MGRVNVRYGALPARAFLNAELLQFFFNELFLYFFPSRLQEKSLGEKGK